jgi:hypothetical protein
VAFGTLAAGYAKRTFRSWRNGPMMKFPGLLVWSAIATCSLQVPSGFAQAAETAATPFHDEHGPIVDAPAGAVEGRMEGKLRVFKGIPYASPPIGMGCWKPPSTVTA